MPPSSDLTTSPNADILGAGGFQSLAVNQAMGKVRAALSKENAGSRDVYAVVVYGKHQAHAEFGYLKTVNAFFEAYWKGWRSLSRLSNLNPSSKPYDFRKINDHGSSDVCIYLGRTNAKNVKEKMTISPGIYVIFSHLDASLLGSMGLPPVPEPFRESPVVVQFKMAGQQPLSPHEDSREWSPWKTLIKQVAVEDKAEEEIERNSLEWRKDFMAEYGCWTSTEVAKQSTSTAKNVSAIASRWVSEGKIFSVRFEGKTWFPRFQFQDGRPIPVVTNVIKTLSKSTGWDLAFFFTSPNAYLGGRRPVELLRIDPTRLESIAQAFVNPTDAF